MPEMIFGNNFLSIEHKSGLKLGFNAKDGLKEVNHKSTLPKVHYSQNWISSKSNSTDTANPEVHKVYEYDWTFSTPYKGTLENIKESQQPEKTTIQIDTDMLKKPDPILFFTDIHLYEDELADNGIALLSVKMRVMPTCFFILLRFWLRIDNVLFRINDTRIFHDFTKDYMLREYQSKEATFKSVTQMLPPDPVKYSDSNLVGSLLKIKECVVEKINL